VREIDAQLRMLEGPLPDKPIGHNCFEPRDCPFLKRCWPGGSPEGQDARPRTRCHSRRYDVQNM